MNDPVVIAGAGPSGLYAASILNANGIECIVLEARNRIGGRVLSSGVEGRPDLGRYDLGPTWFWPEREPLITNLAEELQLQTMEQYTKGAFVFEQSESFPAEKHLFPEGAVEKSKRIIGGMDSLVKAIAATLAPEAVRLSSRVTKIHRSEDESLTVSVEYANGRHEDIRAGAVILAVNPRMIVHHIRFSPELPSELHNSLLKKPTWMGRQAKAIAIYETPFWRAEGLSGHGISRAEPLDEIHDASNGTGSGALFGFFNMSPDKRQALGEEQVLSLVVEQLTRMYGQAAAEPVALLYKDWAMDTKTTVPDDWTRLKDFPEYGVPDGADSWGEKLQFASTETSEYQGGHLEGALRSAERAVGGVLGLIR